MTGNINNKPIGTCSQCGGVVSIPTVWYGVTRPVPSCESCGATAAGWPNLPMIPTIPVPKPRVRPSYGCMIELDYEKFGVAPEFHC